MSKSKKLPLAIIFAVGIIGLSLIFAPRASSPRGTEVTISPSLEDIREDGRIYNPSTQSILRGAHWLESVNQINVAIAGKETGVFEFHGKKDSEDDDYLSIRNLKLTHLVPRLYYKPASPPDAFDAMNLMLAEYSRNSLSVPHGRRGDSMAHFESSLEDESPYHLKDDYEFVPNPKFRPLRVSVTNNCLMPGLWEISAADRSGEIYHGWFDMPPDDYYGLVSRLNRLDKDFVKNSLDWSVEEVPLQLDRLREEKETLGASPVSLFSRAEAKGFSSQDSRRKISMGFAMVEKDGKESKPESLADLTTYPVLFPDFIPPGKYSLTERKRFDLRFLREIQSATVKTVKPLTSYSPFEKNKKNTGQSFVEVTIDLNGYRLVIGNLPGRLLVPQEDYPIYGFGVGVLSSSEPAERRAFLTEQAPPPSFAYICRVGEDNKPVAVNSHEYGLEQVFVRTHIHDENPWWEITLASFERIVDIIKYRVEIPASLHAGLEKSTADYVSPVYRVYRDDNVR